MLPGMNPWAPHLLLLSWAPPPLHLLSLSNCVSTLPHSQPTRKIINQTLSFRASEGRLQIKKSTSHTHSLSLSLVVCRHLDTHTHTHTYRDPHISCACTHTHITKASSYFFIHRLYAPSTHPRISLLGPLVPMVMCGQRCLGGWGHGQQGGTPSLFLVPPGSMCSRTHTHNTVHPGKATH